MQLHTLRKADWHMHSQTSRRVSRGCPPPAGRGSVHGATPPQPFLLFDLKMEHFSAVFKLHLMEENGVTTRNRKLVIFIVHFHCFHCDV